MGKGIQIEARPRRAKNAVSPMLAVVRKKQKELEELARASSAPGAVFPARASKADTPSVAARVRPSPMVAVVEKARAAKAPTGLAAIKELDRSLQAQREAAMKTQAEPQVLPTASVIQMEKKWIAGELNKESTLRSAVKAGDALMDTGAPKAPIEVKPSVYASGSTLSGGSSYAAGLQAREQGRAQTPAVTPEPVGVDVKTRAAHSDQVQQIIPRTVQLVGRSGLLTASETEELEEANRILGQYLTDVGKYVHYGDAEWSQIAPLVELHQAIGRRIQKRDAISTGLVGAVTAIPGAGGGIRWAEGMDRKTSRGKPSEYDYLPGNYNELDYARAEHPLAFAVGRGAGDLGVMLAGGAALRGSGALASLSPLGQSVASSGLMMGATGANDALTDGAPVEKVMEQGVINTLGGMVGGAASYGAGKLGEMFLKSPVAKALFGEGVKDSVVANAVNHGVSGAAFTGSNMATKAILDPDYNPTREEFLTDIGVSFLFATISSAITTKSRSEAAKARLEGDLDRTKELYAQIAWKKAHGMGTDEELLRELSQATQGLRETLSNTQYVGHGQEVQSALGQLDWIDDQIWLATQELGGNMVYIEPTGTTGTLALPFGAVTDAERQAAVPEVFGGVLDSAGWTEKPAESASALEDAAQEFTEGKTDGTIEKSKAQLTDYEVMDLETGDIFHFAEGSRLQNVEVFAGKGSGKIFRKAEKYAQGFGGEPQEWQHAKGIGVIDTPDGDRRVEVHWVQCPGVGKFEFFIKEWLD